MAEPDLIISLNDADLLARMRNFEDHFVERKTVKDEKDWKKSAVAFANSAPLGFPAVLYIGVRDSGQIETPQHNLDDVQKRFNLHMQKVYPRIAYVPKIVSDNGLQAVAIIIPGSELRPHFAGLSYVRLGSETMEASEQQFADMISERSSKTAAILRWKGKPISVLNRQRFPNYVSETSWNEITRVVYCDQFFVTLQNNEGAPVSFPLSRVEINFDNSRKRLELHVDR